MGGGVRHGQAGTERKGEPLADETELRTPPPPMRQGAEGRMSEVGEEGGCPDATRGAAATSGTHVQESGGFYPATRPPPPFTYTL